MIILFWSQMVHWLEQHQVPCIWKSLLHFDCPGCGFQRAFISLLRGDIGQSFIQYPALLPILALFAFTIFHLIRKPVYGLKVIKISFFVCAGVILLSYIYKLLS